MHPDQQEIPTLRSKYWYQRRHIPGYLTRYTYWLHQCCDAVVVKPVVYKGGSDSLTVVKNLFKRICSLNACLLPLFEFKRTEIKILKGVPQLSALFPFGQHDSQVIPVTQ